MWEQMAVPKKIAALVCGYCLLAIRVEELLSKERLGYLLRGPARPPQTPAASFKSRYRKSSAIDIRLLRFAAFPRRYLALGQPIRPNR